MCIHTGNITIALNQKLIEKLNSDFTHLKGFGNINQAFQKQPLIQKIKLSQSIIIFRKAKRLIQNNRSKPNTSAAIPIDFI